MKRATGCPLPARKTMGKKNTLVFDCVSIFFHSNETGQLGNTCDCRQMYPFVKIIFVVKACNVPLDVYLDLGLSLQILSFFLNSSLHLSCRLATVS